MAVVQVCFDATPILPEDLGIWPALIVTAILVVVFIFTFYMSMKD
jgi:hypothetical protein